MDHGFTLVDGDHANPRAGGQASRNAPVAASHLQDQFAVLLLQQLNRQRAVALLLVLPEGIGRLTVTAPVLGRPKFTCPHHARASREGPRVWRRNTKGLARPG